MKTRHYKIEVELHIVGDRVFVNYWDYIGGEDVVSELINGKLLYRNGESIEEITLTEFIDKVVNVVSKY